ncbi:hypothetical protein [Paraburkholderia phenoliruptrix]|uniref:hypothetical protein n=1 Tax=Paraburkholderia phenoliruptrix TaxID=252970 RepID=UPI0028568272|nr:hypothetical protein [Paraburkholderia phenoliruptrix]MDR6392573.1 hypothetical protein [Paraburkholderia phenoliruptrix]
MPRSTRATKPETSTQNEWVEHIINRAAIAAILFDPRVAETLLEIPDAALGRMFKNHLCKAVGQAMVYGIDLPALCEEEDRLRKRVKPESERTPGKKPSPRYRDANTKRYPLVLQGKVLRKHDFCNSAGLTEKKLAKLVESQRVFAVFFGPEAYYPAFFLSTTIFRDDFRKVIRSLGKVDPWSMFDFFTTPIESLGGATPLQRLSAGYVKPVVHEATTAAEQYARLFP